MGSWYDYLKRLKKPDYIVIEPHRCFSGKPTDKIKVTLQYRNKPNKVLILSEVCMSLRGLLAIVEKGEKWGDWGGACKVGDVLYVSDDESEEKVEFT